MATDFTPLNNNDTKELRKEMGLPLKKGLIYWYRDGNCWRQSNVIDYEVVETYMPSGSKSVAITLESGRIVRILSDYLADMQKPAFLEEAADDSKGDSCISGKIGTRIEAEPDSYIVVDLETTGLSYISDEIIQIGAIKYEHGKELARFNEYIKTEVEVPSKVEKLTGISNDFLKMFGKEPKEVLESFSDFVGDSILVGHNIASFDKLFLETEYVKFLKRHFSNDYIDTLYLARKTLPNLKSHSLENLSKEYDIDYSNAHKADEDCVITHYVYEYLTFGSLLDECDVPSSNPKDLIKDDIDQNIIDETLVEVDLSDGWKAALKSILPSISKELGLYEESLSIMANKGKDERVSSYAVCVYEPDLVEDRKNPSRNTVLARVKEEILKSNPNIVSVDSKNPNLRLYGDATEDANGRFSVRIDKNTNKLVECLLDCIRYGINNYTPKAASFACCARYKDCSKEGKCIHPNTLYAKACEYRKNLEKGRIFY